MLIRYNQAIENSMQGFFSQLDERAKRSYAATEALKLGYGGQKYISQVLNISDNSIRVGIKELLNPSLVEEIPAGNIRRSGGGRKKKKTLTPS